MDHRPVRAPTDGGGSSWRLAPPHDAATQGLVVSGFAALPTGRALFLAFDWEDGRGNPWLAELLRTAPVTDADGRDPAATAIAFTSTGLARMGLPSAALDSFAAPFREGMMQEDRLRRLGDRRAGRWLDPVIAGGPLWSANTPQRDPLPGHDGSDDGAALTSTGHQEEQNLTAIAVHALLLLYDADTAAADARAASVSALLAAHGVTIVRTLPLELRPDARGIAREHFGFADGVSQPLPYDEEGAVLVGAAPAPQDPWNGVPLGEFLFGHLNGHHEKAPGPFTPADAKGIAAGLPHHPLAEGYLDLGLNGSYLVVRELRQDVAAFWQAMQRCAATIEGETASGQIVTADWLAERVVGRDRDGRLLCPGGYLTPEAQRDNAFGFFDRDQHGLGCPTGSHVRRANPRDGLSPDAAHKADLLGAANNHRMLRRGRKFGTTLADPAQDDGADRGLLFMCINTDIARQFEFVQQTWLLNRNFATLFDETDPLIGPAGPLTVRDHPLRHIVEVETFVRLVGGDYFFLPSLPAITYLASL